MKTGGRSALRRSRCCIWQNSGVQFQDRVMVSFSIIRPPMTRRECSAFRSVPRLNRVSTGLLLFWYFTLFCNSLIICDNMPLVNRFSRGGDFSNSRQDWSEPTTLSAETSAQGTIAQKAIIASIRDWIWPYLRGTLSRSLVEEMAIVI